jgi:excisionase family DNA binding protein
VPPESRKSIASGNRVAAPLLTVAQVAKLLHRSAAWVYDTCERGELPSRRVGDRVLLAAEDLRALLEAELSQLMPKRGGG